MTHETAQTVTIDRHRIELTNLRLALAAPRPLSGRQSARPGLSGWPNIVVSRNEEFSGCAQGPPTGGALTCTITAELNEPRLSFVEF